MIEDRDERARIALDDVVPVVASLAAEPDLSCLVSRFLEVVRTWASPSAIAAAVRDQSCEAGWRLLGPLSFGSLPLGFERTLGAVLGETPEALARPTLLRPREEVPGVKPRDNFIVPWTFEGDSGVLFLRGVPRPSPANLGEALAVASAPVWPRVLGSPLARMETLLGELRGAAQRLESEAERQQRRLAAASAPAPAPEPSEAEPAGTERLEKLEEALREARREAERAAREAERGAREQAELRERLAGLETAAELTRAERDEARAGLHQLTLRFQALAADRQALVTERQALASEQEAARTEIERLKSRLDAPAPHEESSPEAAQALQAAQARSRELEDALVGAQRELAAARAFGEPKELTERLARLETDLDTTRTERDRARAETARAAGQLEILQAERTAAVAQIEELRQASQAAQATAQATDQALAAAQRDAADARALGDSKDLSERLARAETALETLRTERDRARAEGDRLAAQATSLEAGLTAAGRQLEELRRGVQDAETRAREAEEALAAARREIASAGALGDPREIGERLTQVESTFETLRAERDRARTEAEGLAAEIESLRSHSSPAAGELEELRQAARAAEGKAQAAEDGRAAAEQELAGVRALAEEADGRARDLGERWDGAQTALRQAIAAVRRAAFVPPGLRLSMEDAAALTESKPERTPWMRVALLDRDPVGLEELAAELEKAGLDVKIANYPEELGLLLRTPGARELAAVVCDVMAFRPDQNVAGLFRSWDKDRPGLAYFLSYNPDSSGEMDRARRIPQSLTAGHIPRPLGDRRLVETFEVLSKRKTQS